MTAETPTRVTVDQDGVRRVETAGMRTIARVVVAAAVVVAGVTALAVALIRRAPSPRDESPAPPEPAVAVVPASPPVAAPATAIARATEPRPRALRAARLKPAPTLAPAPQGDLSARDVIPALRAAGEREGIAAFPPPGTKPVKQGIVVPDDFEVPEGYLRHFQTTDDGVQLPPILMFDPDYQFTDEHGAPIRLPDDRVVPPDMAPPGLPIRMLQVPARTP